ncbi:MAG: ribonuclease Z [Thermoplasmata archaeon]
MVSTFKLVFFGIGGSWPVPERNLIALGVQVDSEILLFDCPEGTQKAIMSSSMSFMKISKIFISHFHGDHFLGLAGLIQTMALNNRKNDLEIYGPENAINMISSFLQIGYYSLPFNIKITELSDNEELDFGSYSVKTKRAFHPVFTLAYSVEEKSQVKISKEKMDLYNIKSKEVKILRDQGYILKNNEKVYFEDIIAGTRTGRKIVYTGDTAPMAGMADFAMNCDILVHDSTTGSEFEEKANDYGHSSSRQAAEIAKKANCKMLLLAHISPRYKLSENLYRLEKEAQEIFHESYIAREYKEYIIKVGSVK